MLKALLFGSFCRILTAALFILTTGRAQAAQTADFISNIQDVLADPDVYLGSTTPHVPLLVAGNTLQDFYPTTRLTVDAMVNLINASRHEVLLQIYEYDDGDEAARTVFEALQRRVRRAVADGQPLTVGVVVSHVWPSENTLSQRDVHGLIDEVRARGPQAAHVTLSLASYRGSLLSILHTKTLMVDGQTALVMTGNLNTHGGIAIDSVNMSAQIQGPVVSTLRADWAAAFALSHVEAATGSAPEGVGSAPIEPEAEPAGGKAAHAWTGAVLTRRSRWAPWSDSAPNPQNQGIVALLGTATRDIAIINPSLGAEPIKQALLEAILERKVRVTAILSRHMNAYREHMLFGGDNAEQAFDLYRMLLREGGTNAADKLNILWGATDGKTASPTYQPGNIHAKVTALDDDCLLIGSTNFNWLSFNTSRELTLALMGDGIARPFRTDVWPPIFAAAAPMQPADLKVCGSKGKLDATCAYLKARG